MLVRVCVHALRACVRACVWVGGRFGARGCVCAFACGLTYSSCRVHAPYYSHLCLREVFLPYIINGKIFEKKVLEYKMCVLIFSTSFSETFFILRRIQQDIVVNVKKY